MRVALHTLGCKLNFAETSSIGQQFLDRGYQLVPADAPTDIFVLNTCTVTDRADRECRQIVRRVLRNSPEAFVVVTGCYAQLRPEDLSGVAGVDLVLGTKEKFRIFDHAGDFAKTGASQVFVSCIDEATETDPAASAEAGGRTRAFLKIQDGCDYACTFCTIPLARGSSRSVSPESVLAQARTLVDRGFREIVLTGVNVGDYGTKSATSLFQLMKRLEEIQGLDRIRISSIEPNLLTDAMIDTVLGSEKFCNHFHIPLQSGSDAILRRMQRRYRRSVYERLVTSVKDKDQDAGIGVDVIVGFPGESDDLFEETHAFLADLPVSYLHVFTYSERDHTPAAGFADAVDPRVRSDRSQRLRALGMMKRRAFYASLRGKALPVLIEQNEHEGAMTGLAPNYARVAVRGSDASHVNTIFRTAIEYADSDLCYGALDRSEQGNLPRAARFQPAATFEEMQ